MKNEKLKVGIIGCGAIGIQIAKACQDRLGAKADLVALCYTDIKKTDLLNSTIGKRRLRIDK